MIDLEMQLYNDIVLIIKECKRIGYPPNRLASMINNRGENIVLIAKRLILREDPTDGYITLYNKKRMDLTIEALIVSKPEYKVFFTDEEIEFCRGRLAQYGYVI